jgi:hypothetical protein
MAELESKISSTTWLATTQAVEILKNSKSSTDPASLAGFFVFLASCFQCQLVTVRDDLERRWCPHDDASCPFPRVRLPSRGANHEMSSAFMRLRTDVRCSKGGWGMNDSYGAWTHARRKRTALA